MSDWVLVPHVSGVTGIESYVASQGESVAAPTARERRLRLREVTVVRPHPLAWRTALRLAGGDPKRCRVEPDGAVVVRNPANRRV